MVKAVSHIEDIDWLSSQSYFFYNPALSASHIEATHQFLKTQNSKGFLFVPTSGTSSTSDSFKLVALTKEAFLISAASVNLFADINTKDVWLNALPDFHVGGLSIRARAFLSNSRIVPFYHPHKKWDVHKFITNLNEVTWTSLVPTQIFDIVSHNYQAPSSLKGVFVGGGFMPKKMFDKALELRWPLVLVYGATEVASQIATTQKNAPVTWEDGLYPQLTPLPHVKITYDKTFLIESSALLSYYVLFEKNKIFIQNPKENEIFRTSDYGNLNKGSMTIHGRIDDLIKIGGELVSLNKLNAILKNLSPYGTLIAKPQERLGTVITLIYDCDKNLMEDLVKRFNHHPHILPFERIRETVFMAHIPTTALGKIEKNKLLTDLSLL